MVSIVCRIICTVVVDELIVTVVGPWFLRIVWSGVVVWIGMGCLRADVVEVGVFMVTVTHFDGRL